MRGAAVGDRLREDPRVGTPVERADHDPVSPVVEQRDREALVGPRVVERVESHHADVLEATTRALVDQPVHRLDRRHALGRPLHRRRVSREEVVERSAAVGLRVANDLAVSAGGAAEPDALHEDHDGEEEHEEDQHAENDAEVVEEQPIEIGHEIGGIIAAPIAGSGDGPRPIRTQQREPMARRPGGKAVNRKARQRNVPRAPRTPRAAATIGAPPVDATPVPPVGTPDAREAISLDPPRRVVPPRAALAGSTLTDRERADYHYVERDLRNIGVLTAVMAVLLVAAWLAFNALGLTG
jgi:hypothetical protein